MATTEDKKDFVEQPEEQETDNLNDESFKAPEDEVDDEESIEQEESKSSSLSELILQYYVSSARKRLFDDNFY